MPLSYGNTEEHISPIELTDEALIAIGRLVRACAEIEDIITLHVAVLAEISESKAVILLGRTAVTRRLEIAKYLAQTRGEHALAVHNHAFPPTFAEIIKCRNAIAHGKLMGFGDNGYAFLTDDTAVPESDAAIRIVASYHVEALVSYATMAESAVPILEKHLSVEALRQARLQRPLSPHRKSQAKDPAKRQPPPQSSQA